MLGIQALPRTFMGMAEHDLQDFVLQKRLCRRLSILNSLHFSEEKLGNFNDLLKFWDREKIHDFRIQA